jgi:hypothetical protein
MYLCQHLGLCMSQTRSTAKRRLLRVEATEVRDLVDSKTVPYGGSASFACPAVWKLAAHPVKCFTNLSASIILASVARC